MNFDFENKRALFDIIVYGLGAFVLIKYFIGRIADKKTQVNLDQIVREKENQMRTSIRNLRDFSSAPAAAIAEDKDTGWIETLAAQNEMKEKFYEKLKKAIYWDKGQALTMVSDEIIDIFPLPASFQVSGFEVIENHLQKYEKIHHTDHVLFWCSVAVAEILKSAKKFTSWRELSSDDLVTISLLFYFSIPAEIKREGKKISMKFADFSVDNLVDVFVSKKNYDQILFNVIHRSRDLVPLLGAPVLNLNGPKTLKEQFKDFSKAYHPDRFPMEIFPLSMREQVQGLLTEQFAVFNQEYRNLSNKH